ncbi:MAG: SCP2 sterol-binding domain-containing protein [Saprospiraceae bacterium]|jgi:putative sterol carrier protein|nr:SCP2 sterol-binding domain-containing protein [Saprospiraceae bacterium]MBK8296114.1 SCP2 sterol-binding domain-containing protein [Saprospiraceae bacterium]
METFDFLMNLPNKVNALALEGMNTCFHFDLEGEGGGQVSVIVENGKMISQSGLVGTASCIIRAQAADLKKVFKGELNPMMAILTGKLKISNQAEMLKFAKLLGWM